MKIGYWNRKTPISADDERTWNEFVLQKHEQGTLFHSLMWHRVLENAFGLPFHLLAAKSESGVYEGVLSLYEAAGLSGHKSLYSPPYTVYGGILANNPEAARALAEKAKEICITEKAELIHLRNSCESGITLPGTDLHTNFIKTLPPTEEECLASIPRKSRWTVRNGRDKHQLTWEVNRDWKTLWELHAINLLKLGTPVFSKRYFQKIAEELQNEMDILFVMYQGKPICGVMSFYYRDVCNPYFSGSTAQASFTGANNFMYYALMCHALKRGCKQYDFGKSRKGTGPYQFKVNMGFEPKHLPYQYILNTATEVPNVNPSNPKYALFIKLWSKQPLWTSKIIGPFLNRRLP